LFDDERITRCNVAFERQRPCGRLHFVVRVDVVFDEDGNPMQRTPHPSARSLGVQFRRDALRVWIQFDDRIDLRVEVMDSFQKRFGDL